jgi:hypothetical protein
MSLVTKSQVLYGFIYKGSSVWGSGWWFSILLLWRRIDMAYFIAIILMFLKVFLMVQECTMDGENQLLVTNEPVEFEK